MRQVQLEPRFLVVRVRDRLTGAPVRFDGALGARLRFRDRDRAKERAAHRHAPLDQIDGRGADVGLLRNAHGRVRRRADWGGGHCRKQHDGEQADGESTTSHAPYNIANL